MKRECKQDINIRIYGYVLVAFGSILRHCSGPTSGTKVEQSEECEKGNSECWQFLEARLAV